MNIFIGMETSGALRSRFKAQGHFVISCDILPPEDHDWAGDNGGHVQGDVFATFWKWYNCGHRFDLGIFHPDCTYLTNSAAWAFKEPDFERYPGVGYHQKIKPGTLVGAARCDARNQALQTVRNILELPIARIAIENPIGAITQVQKFAQIVQPYQFGDNASKATGLILKNLPLLKIDPAKYCEPRLICEQCKRMNFCNAIKCGECGHFKLMRRWDNQTDGGQNCLSPGADRWKNRSRTYNGIANAIVEQWGNVVIFCDNKM